MTYQNISKSAVDTATPLEFTEPARFAQLERQANITIEVAPDGLHIKAEYTGTLASIPAAIERLRSAGVLELVSRGATKPATPAGGHTPARKPAGRVQPAYDTDGSPLCPVHRKPLSAGRYGPYCPSRATGDQAANDKGYCSIRFAE